jgi:nitric oxide reductase subunit C
VQIQDPHFWRAGAISTTAIMLVVLAILTLDSLASIRSGGGRVPNYDVINRHIEYTQDWSRGFETPVLGADDPLFGRPLSLPQATDLIRRGKLVIQSRACMDCHTFFGNGAYYAPDLTKSWLDPAWSQIWMPMTGSKTREEAMVKYLMHPDQYPTWTRRMPDLHLTREEAEAVTAYLKWMSAVDSNGFPARFGHIEIQN